MRKMESYTYKRWNKMWRLWKRNKLDSPLNELVTYDNYMAHGHLYYFQYLRYENEIKRNIWVIKNYLSKEIYDNLLKAYEIYKDNLEIINNKKISDFEIEKLFMEVDEKFYEDAYELTKIIMIELSDFTNIKINNFKEKWRIMKKFKK